MKCITSIQSLQDQLLDMLYHVDSTARSNGITYFLSYGSALGAVRNGGPIPWDTDLDLLVPTDQYQRLCSLLDETLPGRYEVLDDARYRHYPHTFARVAYRGLDHKYLHIDLFPLSGTSSVSVLRRAHVAIGHNLDVVLHAKTRAAELLQVSTERRKRRRALVAHILLSLVPYAVLWWVRDRVFYTYAYSTSDYLANVVGSYGSREIWPKRIFDKSRDLEFGKMPIQVPAAYEEFLVSLYGDYEEPPCEEEIERAYELFHQWYFPAVSKVPLLLDRTNKADGR